MINTFFEFLLGSPVYLQILIIVAVIVIGIAYVLYVLGSKTTGDESGIKKWLKSFFTKNTININEDVKPTKTSIELETAEYDKCIAFLKNHVFFHYLNRFEQESLRNIDFLNEGKNEIMLKGLFPTFSSVFHSNFMNFVETIDFEEDTTIVKNKFVNLIYTSLNMADANFLKLAENVSEEEASKYILEEFSKINNSNIKKSIEMIERIFEADDSKSIQSKIHMSLFIVIEPFVELSSSAVLLFKSMNGHLKGKTYKNKSFDEKC